MIQKNPINITNALSWPEVPLKKYGVVEVWPWQLANVARQSERPVVVKDGVKERPSGGCVSESLHCPSINEGVQPPDLSAGRSWDRSVFADTWKKKKPKKGNLPLLSPSVNYYPHKDTHVARLSASVSAMDSGPPRSTSHQTTGRRQEAGGRTQTQSLAGLCSHFKKMVQCGQSVSTPGNYTHILQLRAASHILIPKGCRI